MFSATFPGQLRLAHKFLILSVIALLLVSIPTFFYVHEAAWKRMKTNCRACLRWRR